ncbi:MAG TPA: TPM domain-containing protein [Gordonia sp. (in: high G+C Gram-positive bacteria)]|uniref:TPM domain-containing protein n=1 Tax=unclassified Gordonia (in: high G+C Gram-positive bacteria) TaxID=2657482 RepID=UPI000FA85553|nr:MULTISPECIES: TPM domain-containing protein [unclassified Gordonia (in: high G+C Gram-positive bacteria)]RUP38101.1 MAG: TPM domain-containing protein [Gordonia sp. (in: high G+C Gram-positive bacteria)]HNP56472.1 TPM domain-containing protein [Gordonia sp. (in: high G+C Gram-positive bacteria)]HRC50209.1 TPM domain-containing protein [Gordonia sp. (in: high G+C Gram-positive bacteria)]
MLHARLILRQFAAAAVLFASLSIGMIAAGTARAEPPMTLPEQLQIHDPAGVINAAERTKLQRAIDRLYNERGLSLWVVYVKTFDNRTAADWANQVITASEFTDRDVLLAVATDARRYYLSAPEGLGQDKVNSIAAKNVEPNLKKGEWAQAGIAAANGIDRALDGSNTLTYVAAGVGGTAAVVGGGAYLYSRRRRQHEAEERLDSLRNASDELTVDQLSTQSIEVLDDWSKEILTDTDNAVRTSTDELALAVDEFGEQETAPFRKAVEAAQKGIADSFVLRQRLDDAITESADERRSMLVQIITTCHDVDGELDRQVRAFDEMRNLLLNAPERLDDLTRSVVDLKTRTETAEATLSLLIAKHGEERVKSVSHNVELAEKQIVFAEENIDAGRDAVEKPAGRQGAAVAAIRAAEGAVEQARRLLDAIGNADGSIATAATRLPALIDEVTAEIEQAGTLDRSSALDTAVETAHIALQYAAANADTDPLGSFTTLVDADTALDEALDSGRAATNLRKRNVELRETGTAAAAAKVSAARDFIATRRGAVQTEARTRLAEAERLLASAQKRPAGEAVEAVDEARRAGALADQALMSAQADVVSWQRTEQPAAQGGDPSAIGAVLGGILVDSFLRGGGGGLGGGRIDTGGFPSRRGDGYSYDGRSPGSFGGSGSSGRIGVGGRF